MTFEIILVVILTGIALSADAFSVAVTDGLVYTDINKKRAFFIAATFGIFQGVMPLIGYWIVEGASQLAKTTITAVSPEQVGDITSAIVAWLAFALLVFIGGKMLIESIKDIKKNPEEKEPKKFSVKEVLIMGVATAIDAMASGVQFHAGTSTNTTIWLHAPIIVLCTFIFSIIGVTLAHKLQKLFKGKYEITGIIGGSILILLGIWAVLEWALGI